MSAGLIGCDWIGLDWIGLDWIGLDWKEGTYSIGEHDDIEGLAAFALAVLDRDRALVGLQRGDALLVDRDGRLLARLLQYLFDGTIKPINQSINHRCTHDVRV